MQDPKSINQLLHVLFNALRQTYEIGNTVCSGSELDYKAWHDNDGAESGSITMGYTNGYVLNINRRLFLTAVGAPIAGGHHDAEVLRIVPHHLLWLPLPLAVAECSNSALGVAVREVVRVWKVRIQTESASKNIVWPSPICFKSLGQDETLTEYRLRLVNRFEFNILYTWEKIVQEVVIAAHKIVTE